MKISIFIHGVPNGQRMWSTDGTDAIVTNFYGQGQGEDTKFVAEVKKNGGNVYAYYSYFKYNNVYAYDGRAGSYVGMTVRMDALCTDVINIYNVLDIVYNRDVLGRIVSCEGGKTRFIRPDLTEGDCKPIESSIVALLQGSLQSRSFTEVKEEMAKNGNAVILNPLDCDRANLVATLRQGTTIAISPQYDTIRESMIQQECQKKLTTITSEKERQASEQQREIAGCKSLNNKMQTELNMLNSKLSQYETEISQLRKENSSLQDERKRNPQTDIKRRVDDINGKIDSLSRKIDHIASSTTSESPRKKRSFIPIVSSAIVFFAVAIIGAMLFFQNKAIGKDLSGITEKIDSIYEASAQSNTKSGRKDGTQNPFDEGLSDSESQTEQFESLSDDHTSSARTAQTSSSNSDSNLPAASTGNPE